MARQTRVTLWLFAVKRDKETLNGLVAQGRILSSSPGGVGSLGRLVIDYTVPLRPVTDSQWGRRINVREEVTQLT